MVETDSAAMDVIVVFRWLDAFQLAGQRITVGIGEKWLELELMGLSAFCCVSSEVQA
jgi:hypothetical protein